MERGSGSRRGGRRRAIAIEAELAVAAVETTSAKLGLISPFMDPRADTGRPCVTISASM
jgi:hypothetical protein